MLNISQLSRYYFTPQSDSYTNGIIKVKNTTYDYQIDFTLIRKNDIGE